MGLDTDLTKIPEHLKSTKNPLGEFNKAIIDATADLVCSYKPNSAYYEAMGDGGMRHLQKTIEYIHTAYPDIPVIVDAKRADIGSTSEQYANWVFDYLKADAVTVNPYLGSDSLDAFFKRSDKGIIVLCRTSNKGATDFQDLNVDGQSLFMKVAERIIEWDKIYKNCLMVVGATWPEQMQQIRGIAPDMNFLVPGIGTQGGDLAGTLKAGLRADKAGLIINAGRSIIYASNGEDFAEKARLGALKLRDQINLHR